MMSGHNKEAALMQQISPAPPKKPYQTPQLRVYGNLRELTKLNTVGKGKQDNAFLSSFKT